MLQKRAYNKPNDLNISHSIFHLFGDVISWLLRSQRSGLQGLPSALFFLKENNTINTNNDLTMLNRLRVPITSLHTVLIARD